MNNPFSNWTPLKDVAQFTNSLLGGVAGAGAALLPGLTGGTTTTQTTGGTAADKGKMNTLIIVGVVVVAIVVLIVVFANKNKS